MRMHGHAAKPAAFGSKIYHEELVAEISSCFLCNEAGIMNEVIDNSAAISNIGMIGFLKSSKKTKGFSLKPLLKLRGLLIIFLTD